MQLRVSYQANNPLTRKSKALSTSKGSNFRRLSLVNPLDTTNEDYGVTDANEENKISSDSSYDESSFRDWGSSGEEDERQFRDVRTFLTGKPVEHIDVGVSSVASVPKLQTDTSIRVARLYTLSEEDNRSSDEMFKSGILDTLLETDPDVLILSEYHWYETTNGEDELKLQMQAQGYTLYCASGFAPMAIATRLEARKFEEVTLDYERSAIILNLQLEDEDKYAWVCALNVCDYDEEARHSEMSIVTEWLEEHTSASESVILSMNSVCDSRNKSITADTSECTCTKGFHQSFKHANLESCFTKGCHPDLSNCVSNFPCSRNIQMVGSHISTVGWSDNSMSVFDWK